MTLTRARGVGAGVLRRLQPGVQNEASVVALFPRSAANGRCFDSGPWRAEHVPGGLRAGQRGAAIGARLTTKLEKQRNKPFFDTWFFEVFPWSGGEP
jgi:hypothetical protein